MGRGMCCPINARCFLCNSGAYQCYSGTRLPSCAICANFGGAPRGTCTTAGGGVEAGSFVYLIRAVLGLCALCAIVDAIGACTRRRLAQPAGGVPVVIATSPGAAGWRSGWRLPRWLPGQQPQQQGYLAGAYPQYYPQYYPHSGGNVAMGAGAGFLGGLLAAPLVGDMMHGHHGGHQGGGFGGGGDMGGGNIGFAADM